MFVNDINKNPALLIPRLPKQKVNKVKIVMPTPREITILPAAPKSILNFLRRKKPGRKENQKNRILKKNISRK
jgi:hypothetical protein